MLELFTGTIMQRLVLYCTISLLLVTIEITWEDARFWCMITCLFLLEHLASIEGEKRGVGNILGMHRSKLLKIKDFMDSVESGNDHDISELNEILKKEDKKDE